MTLDTYDPDVHAPAPGSTDRLVGVYPATVDDVHDPDGLARVSVRFPWRQPHEGHLAATWARVATLGAGPDRGVAVGPSVGDEVLIAFEAGDPAHPYVLGALWSAVAHPPQLPPGRPDGGITIRSASGVEVTFSDEEFGPRLVLHTPEGREVTLDDHGAGGVTVTDADRSRIHLGVDGVEVHSEGRVSIDAVQVEVTAGSVQLHTGMVRADGVLQAKTLVVDHVVAESYTPGAGNIW